MKPIELTMSAFGSYGGVEKISFENQRKGLFLIAGDTGSGKSTIFDAIMFALYDTMSGKERKGVMMRSEYASDSSETYVEFVFEYGYGDYKGIYRIKRYPAYERKSKRKDKDGRYKMIRQTGKVSLTMPDGSEYPEKIAGTNKKIEEIIGLTAEQFSKIAMIAQGEFQDLIMDKTGKRKEIFQQIFSTQIYEEIEKKIWERYKKSLSEMKENATKLGEMVQGAAIEEDSPYREMWEDAFIKKDTEPEKLSLVLQKEIERQDAILISEQKKSEELQKQMEQIQLQIRQLDEINHLLEQLAGWKRKQEEQKDREPEILKKEKALLLGEAAAKVFSEERVMKQWITEMESILPKRKLLAENILEEEKNYQENLLQKEEMQIKYEKMHPVLIEQKGKLTESLEFYKEYVKKQKEVKQTENEVQNLKQELVKKLKLEEELQKSQQEQKVYIEENTEIELKQNKLEQREKELTKWYILLEKIEDKKEEVKKQKKICETADLKLAETLEKWRQKRRKHEECNHAYIRGQSAFLAKELEEGMPCPVCGSVTHPIPAAWTEDIVTKEMLEAARSEEEKAEQKKEESQSVSEKEHSKMTALQTVLDELMLEVNQNTKDLPQDLIQCEKLQTECKNEWKILSEQLEKREDAKRIQKELSHNLEIVSEQKEMLKTQIVELEKKWEVLNNTIEMQKRQLIYDSEQEALQALQSCEQELDALEKKQSKITRILAECEKRLENAKGERLQIEKQEIRCKKMYEEALLRFEEKRAECGFADEEEYQKAICPDEVLEGWKQEITDYRQSCIETEAKKKTLEEQTVGKSYADLSSYQEALVRKQEEYLIQDKSVRQIQFAIQNNQNAKLRLDTLMSERGTLMKKQSIIKALNDTANGKIHFQTYIQRQYFKQIIQAANQRMARMAEGGFLLKCREIQTGGQGETGLELDVYNPVTGKIRDAHTLSGGETFIASLAMALGMADIVQNTVGKTKIDTMFIDEGFGSLSDEVREKAVQVLLELTGDNRLVGVISHVTELKEQIPHKLLVKKGRDGSHVFWEIE